MTFAFMAITSVPINVAGRATVGESGTNPPERRIRYRKEGPGIRSAPQVLERTCSIRRLRKRGRMEQSCFRIIHSPAFVVRLPRARRQVVTSMTWFRFYRRWIMFQFIQQLNVSELLRGEVN